MHNRHVIDHLATSKSVAFFIPVAKVLHLSALKILEHSISFPFVPLYQVFRCSPKQKMSPYKWLLQQFKTAVVWQIFRYTRINLPWVAM